MSKVLVATAGTDFDQQGMGEAFRLLGPDHEYLFLTVYEGQLPVLATGSAVGGPAPVIDPGVWHDMEVTAEADAWRRVRDVVDAAGITARLRVEEGEPGATICRVAADEHADVIIVGSHHAGVLRRILGGSVADDVAHHAPCPVLVVRRSEHPASSPADEHT
jgi:nucleotide-binding universal stress UspA family protein